MSIAGVDAPTFDALYAAYKAEVQSRNAALTDWVPGSMLDSQAGAGSVLADEVVRVLFDIFAAFFLSTAEGGQVDAWSADHFGDEVPRKVATASTGSITYAKGTGINGTIDAGTRIRGTVAGVSVTVETTHAVSVASTDTTVSLPCVSQDTGTGQNVDPGVLTELVDVPSWDSGPTVTNAERFAGGSAEETDDKYKGRLRLHYSTLRKGTVAALKLGALSVPGVDYAAISEANAQGSEGYVDVFAGDPDGASNSTLASLVAAEMESWRAAGIRVQVTGSSRLLTDYALTVYVYKNTNQDEASEAIKSAVTAAVNDSDPGQTAGLSVVSTAASNAHRGVRRVVVTSPTTDVAPSGSQAVRTTEDRIAISFVEE